MAQLTIYLDDQTLKKIEGAAKREHESISRWVKKRLTKTFQNTWPDHYFDLFGSLADTNFTSPKPPKGKSWKSY